MLCGLALKLARKYFHGGKPWIEFANSTNRQGVYVTVKNDRLVGISSRDQLKSVYRLVYGQNVLKRNGKCSCVQLPPWWWWYGCTPFLLLKLLPFYLTWVTNGFFVFCRRMRSAFRCFSFCFTSIVCGVKTFKKF